jgi:hypothetical protein
VVTAGTTLALTVAANTAARAHLDEWGHGTSVTVTEYCLNPLDLSQVELWRGCRCSGGTDGCSWCVFGLTLIDFDWL